MLLQLASPGVCGHPDMAHGGVLATVIDRAMSLGATLYAPEAGESGSGSESGRIRSNIFTSQLDVRYKRGLLLCQERLRFGLLFLRNKRRSCG
ncbi:hypothetical protein BJX99DRAFT_225467 [Aspergillus californicus]